MNNLFTTLSFSLYSNKGIYALLVGSGISRTSGISTGWDVVVDLIKKLAAINNEACEPNPEQWFINKYGEDPDYSSILAKLAQTPSERVNLLKPYFEANSEEQEQGLKQPTKAHEAIAKLIKEGYIKVVITTNFDRLLENALQKEGINFVVIKHSEDVEGALPLVHSDVVLVKINGDYLDSRFLNTQNELADYPDKLKKYILQIINEYGLITCGWSGKWDKGLVNMIKQSENFRFNSFWTYIGNCESELSALATFRKGQTLEIQDADSFFTDIEERVSALNSINSNHPLNAEIAVARLKKYIVKDEYRILLHDLLYEEQENVYRKINEVNNYNVKLEKEVYEESIELLLPMIIHGVYWMKPEHEEFFLNILARLAEPPMFINGNYYRSASNSLYYYPALIILYTAGITAVKIKKFSFLNKLFQLKTIKSSSDFTTDYIIRKIHPNCIEKDVVNSISEVIYKTPLSTIINQKLNSYFTQIINNKNEFTELQGIFEYLLSINYMELNNDRLGEWCPHGEFKWRPEFHIEGSAFYEFFHESLQLKDNWPPIKAGMFKGSYIQYKLMKDKTDAFLKNVHVY